MSKDSAARRGPAAASAARRKKRKAATRLAPAAPVGLSEVGEVIAQWSPSERSGVRDWDTIALTVRGIVAAAAPGGVEMARKYLTALARHTDARARAGMATSDWQELLRDDALVATLGASAPGGQAASTRRTELTYLRRLREKAVPDAYGKASELALSRTETATPYSESEAAALLAWAGQASSTAAGRVRGVVLLGLGAGFDGREVPGVRGSDVRRTPWGLVVCAPGTGKGGGSRPARIVPVLAAYEQRLARAAAAAGPEPMAGAGMVRSRDLNALAAIVEKSPGMPALSGARLRATWTRTLLAGYASYVAMRQAGVSADPSRTMGALSADIVMPVAQFVTELRFGQKPFQADAAAFADLREWGGQ